MTLRFVVDTDVVSESAKPRPNPDVIRFLTAEARMALCAISVFELASGVESAPAGARRVFLEAWLARILGSSIEILPFDRDTALSAARLAQSASRRGKGIDDHDLFIAAAASVRGLAVATHNVSHFRGLGLSIFDPFTGSWSI
jgi:predicted nucleic acid-binding protein